MDVFVRTMARATIDDGAELASALLHLLAPAQPIVRYEGPLRALVSLLRAHKILLPNFMSKELARDAIELVGRDEGRLHSLYGRLMEEVAGSYLERCLGNLLRQVASGSISDMPQESETSMEEKPLEQSLQYTTFQIVVAVRNSLTYCPQSVRHAVELARAELSKTVHYTLVDRVVGKLLLSLLFGPAVRFHSLSSCIFKGYCALALYLIQAPVDQRSDALRCVSSDSHPRWPTSAAQARQ